MDGVDEIVQQALFRLSIPKGSFIYDPSIGSDIRSLKKGTTHQMNQQAFAIVEQALIPMVDVTVENVKCKLDDVGCLFMDIDLIVGDNTAYLEVSV